MYLKVFLHRQAFHPHTEGAFRRRPHLSPFHSQRKVQHINAKDPTPEITRGLFNHQKFAWNCITLTVLISDFVLMQIPGSNGTLALSTFAADVDGATAHEDQEEGATCGSSLGATIATTIADPVAPERDTAAER